ncbi:MAG: nucleotidyltransferase [Bacilli bacterium]|jgi:UTP-glucose-1-phosphate uridylyltransferase|nr:nucleotidyltransferase [Bacilli bacterium]
MQKTLLVMAAGMGSRFGGLKQIEPMGPNGEFLIDYSVYDAKLAGFTKIVFIIKEENYDIFKETIGKRVEPYIETEYVFQDDSNLKEKYKDLQTRVKPLGTGHAILCAKDKVKTPFAIINADDFYGRDAYVVASKYLDKIDDKHYAVVGYKVGKTLSPNGAAKRGICKEENGKLKDLIESSVEKIDDKIIAKPLDGETEFIVEDDSLVSMNMLLFTPKIFDYLEEKLIKFLETNKNDLSKCEFLIPDVVKDAIKEDRVEVDLLSTNAIWHGVTYKEDKEEVVKAIDELIKEKVYPNKLW